MRHVCYNTCTGRTTKQNMLWVIAFSLWKRQQRVELRSLPPPPHGEVLLLITVWETALGNTWGTNETESHTGLLRLYSHCLWENLIFLIITKPKQGTALAHKRALVSLPFSDPAGDSTSVTTSVNGCTTTTAMSFLSLKSALRTTLQRPSRCVKYVSGLIRFL